MNEHQRRRARDLIIGGTIIALVLVSVVLIMVERAASVIPH
jgi:hypothetical protein